MERVANACGKGLSSRRVISNSKMIDRICKKSLFNLNICKGLDKRVSNFFLAECRSIDVSRCSK